jgi:asparagine synthase (glutamine-hydrolysing)
MAKTSDVLITTMRERMVHRGRMARALALPRAVLFRSPAPLDHRSPDAASQPMLNQSGTVSIFFNGEIYNHAEVRHGLETLNKYT